MLWCLQHPELLDLSDLLLVLAAVHAGFRASAVQNLQSLDTIGSEGLDTSKAS